MTASLAAQVTIPEMTSLMPMLELFAPDSPKHSSLRKRLYMDKDLEETHVRVRRAEEKYLEHTLTESRYDESMR